MNLVASLGQGAPVKKSKRGPKPGYRVPPRKGGSTALIIAALAASEAPMSLAELIAATGKKSGTVAFSLNYGVKNGDFVREGAVWHYRYSLPRFE